MEKEFIEIINLSKAENYDYYKNNFNKLLKTSNNIFLLKSLIENSKELIDKFNKYIDDDFSLDLKNEKFDLVVNSIIDCCKKAHTPILETDETLKDVLKLIIFDIFKNEKARPSDVKVINQGAFSTTVIIKNKVLKVGSNRGTVKFKDNPFIIRPLIRLTNIEPNYIYGKGIHKKDKYFIEVTERAITSENISIKRMYKLYKKARNMGIIFGDARNDNYGILRNDNIVHWKEELPIKSKVLGLKNNSSETVLKRGNAVFIDNDFIYDENDKNMRFCSANSIYFERLFLGELIEVLKEVKFLIDKGYDFDSKIVKKIISRKGFDEKYIKNKINNPEKTQKIMDNIFEVLNAKRKH